MNLKLGQITLVVRDYDEAIDYYTKKLGFVLQEDTALSDTKRWVVVSPGEDGCRLLLAKAVTENQEKAIGNQTGGRVFLFLYARDIETYYRRLIELNVPIVRHLSTENYGKVFVFEDLYGNLWDVIEETN
jgi:catechol 2,3-dioxygenase-like lactoylglutathione lyase family enzyme